MCYCVTLAGKTGNSAREPGGVRGLFGHSRKIGAWSTVVFGVGQPIRRIIVRQIVNAELVMIEGSLHSLNRLCQLSATLSCAAEDSRALASTRNRVPSPFTS